MNGVLLIHSQYHHSTKFLNSMIVAQEELQMMLNNMNKSKMKRYWKGGDHHSHCNC